MEGQSQEQNKELISKTNFFIMLVAAIFVDVVLSLIQLIPFAGSVAASVFNVIPLMIFFIWYKLLGISFANPKKAVSFFGASVIEFIPIINILPTWTAEIIYMYTLQNKDKILSVVAGATKVASVTGAGGKMASFLPQSGMAGRALGEVSHQASRVAQQAEMVSELRKNNFVGNEIRPKNDKNVKEMNNIVKFPTAEKVEPSNVIPFPGEEKNIPFNRDVVSENKKVA
jgi:hypothetical protein